MGDDERQGGRGGTGKGDLSPTRHRKDPARPGIADHEQGVLICIAADLEAATGRLLTRHRLRQRCGGSRPHFPGRLGGQDRSPPPQPDLPQAGTVEGPDRPCEGEAPGSVFFAVLNALGPQRRGRRAPGHPLRKSQATTRSGSRKPTSRSGSRKPSPAPEVASHHPLRKSLPHRRVRFRSDRSASVPIGLWKRPGIAGESDSSPRGIRIGERRSHYILVPGSDFIQGSGSHPGTSSDPRDQARVPGSTRHVRGRTTGGLNVDMVAGPRNEIEIEPANRDECRSRPAWRRTGSTLSPLSGTNVDPVVRYCN